MQDKNKWYIASSISVIVIGICIIGFVSNSGKKESETSVIAIRSNTPALKPSEIRKHLKEAKNFDPPDPAEKVKSAIASHQARIEADPEDPESPALLEAMGNLYMLKLNDYGMAAYCYEQVLLHYPDADKTAAYIGLVTALEKKGDVEGVNRICREIRKVYPPESVEYQWAADKTGMKMMTETVPADTEKDLAEEQPAADGEEADEEETKEESGKEVENQENPASN